MVCGITELFGVFLETNYRQNRVTLKGVLSLPLRNKSWLAYVFDVGFYIGGVWGLASSYMRGQMDQRATPGTLGMN